MIRVSARSLAAAALALALAGPSVAQTTAAAPAEPAPASHATPTHPASPRLRASQWPARWIAHPTAPGKEFGVQHFRKVLRLPAKPSRYLVHVSGDNRYRLFVNGTSVATGPASSELRHWSYESVDIAPHLKPGRNVLAAVVWNGGEQRHMARFSNRTGFILQGDTPAEDSANTNASWRVLENRAVQPLTYLQNDPRILWEYYVAGPLDSIRGERYPWGWERPEYQDSGWVEPRVIAPGVPAPLESHQAWNLAPRQVPPPLEQPQRFRRIARSTGATLPTGFVAGGAPGTVPPNTHATFLVDHGELTFGYPVLRVSGGRGAVIRATYSEALYTTDSLAAGKKFKAHRERLEGQQAWGVYDVFVADGGRDREYRPLDPRTFRWVELDVRTGAEPLVLEDYRSVSTAYPSTLRARFASDRPILGDLWRAGWRTLELSSHETFVSDLYWERIQYIGDTKIQALAWLYTTGDDRLVRLALEHFDQSRTYIGLTQSRYPAYLEQNSPLYALAWITMLHDYSRHRDDPVFLRQFMPGVRTVLGWFQRQVNADGLIPNLPWLDFVDWSYAARQREIEGGTGPKGLTVHTLYYAMTLDQAAELFERQGAHEEARAYRREAETLRARVRACCYDEPRGLFTDTPGRPLFSEHANVMAVLSGAVPPAEQRALMRRMLDADLLPVDFYFEYYMGRALNQAGLGDVYVERLGPWKRMLALGMKTFGEVKENPRSENHAWAASPTYELLATVAGVEPGSHGFRTVRVAPHLGRLRRVEATVPHPKGEVVVHLRRRGAEGIEGEVTLPPGVDGVFVWSGVETPLRPGRQRVRR